MYTRSHEKLIAWQEAYKLSLYAYKLTRNFPSDERFGLCNQMRRAAYSVPLNIAEGNTRHSKKDRQHFFEMAHSSLEELHCQTRLSFDLHYLDEDAFIAIDDWINRISYLLGKLRYSLR